VFEWLKDVEPWLSDVSIAINVLEWPVYFSNRQKLSTANPRVYASIFTALIVQSSEGSSSSG
jgi:hypothetical protein